MINITEAFRNLIEHSEQENTKEVYKLKTLFFQQPFTIIGIDLITMERRLYIDITEENWDEEQLKSFPKWKGLSVKKEFFGKIGPLKEKDFLIIAQETEKSEEIFEKILQSLVDRIFEKEDRNLFSIIYEILDRWHNFFRYKNNKKLSTEEQMGVFGELYYIHNWLNKFPEEPPLIVNYWKGPTRHRIDFVKNNIGVEIKTMSPKLHEEIRISSEKQLELSTVIKKIYLYILKIEDTQSDGQTIQDLIDSIRIKLSDRAPSSLMRFNDLLMELYIVDGIYNDIFFYVHNEETYEVTNQFPRITSEDLPIGVSNVSYSIDLSHCKNFKIETEKAYYLSKEG
ncbi:PD-(D/E)XK motif protein [Paenisporosarcina antarctica]|uniref:PD-(D/E)XK motif protein n=1 Tax=Paenisporosarcina antarctica TaxID=417367 RepID=A0A4P6ZTR9_9BACL|nr:PD-(D/E)XK motif protein [Paenisporosarcina antarctica]QBP39711.1 PD-(D/E)XK motif protein [Paenisporosarcina antarctica]